MNPLDYLQAADLHWDQAANVLRVSVSFQQGTVNVIIPMSTVAIEFVRAAQEERMNTLGDVDILGDLELTGPSYDLETVGGFWSAIKSVGKAAVNTVKKTVKKVRNIAKNVAKNPLKAGLSALKTARKVVTSKWTGYALMGVSAVCPAVGAPAMAAWMAAKAAERALSEGGQVAKQVADSVKALAGGKSSVLKSLGVAALQSVGDSRAEGAADLLSKVPARLPYKGKAKSKSKPRKFEKVRPRVVAKDRPKRFEKKATNKLSRQQPQYQRPQYQQPQYQQPQFQQAPMYQQPMYQQPMYQQPMYQQPMYQQPMYQQPMYQLPWGR